MKGRCRRSDVRGQRMKDRGQRSEVGSRMVDTRVMEELAHVLMPWRKVVSKTHLGGTSTKWGTLALCHFINCQGAPVPSHGATPVK